MPQYNIRGITVTFPYEAYDCQIKLMESVIASLQGVSVRGHLLSNKTETLCVSVRDKMVLLRVRQGQERRYVSYAQLLLGGRPLLPENN